MNANSSTKNSMHVFISGPSGIGKTTVTDELARRGYNAFDTDMVPGMARLEIQETGAPAVWPTGGYVDWKKYGWSIQPEVLDNLLSNNENVFLSGICHNQPDFYHKFGKLIVLTADIDEYARRMRTRPYRGANDDEVNILQRIEKYPIMINRLLDSGFIAVDHSGSPEETVNTILELIQKDS